MSDYQAAYNRKVSTQASGDRLVIALAAIFVSLLVIYLILEHKDQILNPHWRPFGTTHI
jgi:hypothetical protein